MIRYNSTFFQNHASDALTSVGGAVETGADAVRETSRGASLAVEQAFRKAAAQLRRRSRAAERSLLRWAAAEPGATPRPAWPMRTRAARRWEHSLQIRTASRRLAALAAAAALAIGGVVSITASAAQPELAELRGESVTQLPAVPQDGQGGENAAPAPEAAAPGIGSTAPEEGAGDAGPAEPAPSVPLDNMQITSDYGMRYAFGTEFHTGTDFSAVTGTPVKAARAGTVVYAHWHYEGGGGLRVVVDHGDGYQSTYNHLNDIYVEEGQWVDFNQCIGAVGSTGNSTGPHLHFEVLCHGEYVDPMAWLQS